MSALPQNLIAIEPSSARIRLDKTGPLESFIGWATCRMFGRELDPIKVASHHKGVLRSYIRLELSSRKWRKLSPTLQGLAQMVIAQEIECSWCIDFGYWVKHNEGVDPAKLREVPNWRTSPVYTDVERAVMEFAVAATATPPSVTDEMVAQLQNHLTEAQVVELTAFVALENFRSRTNSAMGLTSQGFKAECEAPTRR